MKSIPFFIPPLSLQLEAEEKKLGRSLTESEVIQIRDRAPNIMMEAADAQIIFKDRGYSDLDPNDVWKSWLTHKDGIGRSSA